MIEIVERSVRAPREGEIRIHVKAAAVSPTDILLREVGAPGVEAPITPGMDAAGVVEAVGPNVTRLKVGDEVMAALNPRRPEGGAQAEFVVVLEASAVRKPSNITLVQAATLPMNGMTALLALELASIPQGETLAVSGGAGLLAHYAIAAARRQGINVIADAKPEELELVDGCGATTVVERSGDFAAAVRKHAPDGVDALLDTAVLGEKAFPAIKDGGVYLPFAGGKTSRRREESTSDPFGFARSWNEQNSSRPYVGWWRAARSRSGSLANFLRRRSLMLNG
ncbi:quinone oxidoreductase family protein [Rhizobium leguminosarum]|uniref:quinone oxidoreductase family protein n=1 Tax=Rhizobium leguminosarum TaxID=384 RepID=UPI001AEBC9F7|nr:alcohol dehydrogenase catalytic domain-containing protein [Rhizobium leguminosarum]